MYNWPIIKQVLDVFSFLLVQINNLIGNYGWSIIILTIVFRLLLLPLDIRSKVSMRKTSMLQPKLAKINEKYKNDKEKAAQKTMELYKQEKVSPLSGCLPALIQWPFFIAFFSALSAMAGTQLFALYNATIQHGVTYALNPNNNLIEQWLWVHNVWAPDTGLFGPNGFNIFGFNSSVIPPATAVAQYTAFRGIPPAQYQVVMGPLMAATSGSFNGWFILPILAGITSWYQTKMTMPAQQATPAPTGQQSKFSGKSMQYIFPAISVLFTINSNSVFALYWVTSNLCAIATYKAVDIVWKRREERQHVAEHTAQQAEAERLAAVKERNQKMIESSRGKGKGNAAAGKPGNDPKEGTKQ